MAFYQSDSQPPNNTGILQRPLITCIRYKSQNLPTDSNPDQLVHIPRSFLQSKYLHLLRFPALTLKNTYSPPLFEQAREKKKKKKRY